MTSSLLVILLTVLQQAGPFHDLSFDQACAKAKTDGKVVMLDFFTTWCPPCRDLDRITWKNEEVRRWLLAKAVAVKVNAEKDHALAERFQVRAYPTLLFVNPDGSVLGRMVGYRKPSVFLEGA